MAAWPSSSFISSSWGGGAGTGGAVSFASLAASSSFPGGTAPGGNPVGLGGMNPFSPGQAAFGSGAGPSNTLSTTQPNAFSGQSSSVLGASLTASTSPFGASSSSLFSSASSSFGASTLFGSASSSSSSSPFGSSTLFGASSSSPFGVSSSSSTSSLFGAPSPSSSSPFDVSSSSSTSSLFGAPSSSSSSPFGVSSSSSTSSLFGAPSCSSSSPFGVSSSSLFGSSSSPFGTAGGTAPAAALEGGQGAKSEGTKFIDAWKNLEAAAKGGIWPFSSFGVAEAECLFVGLDISPEEHRYLFYQRPQSEWRALGEQIVATQLQHLRQFHALVGEKAAADRLSFEAAPPSVEFLRLVLGGSLPETSFSVPQETLQTPSLGALGAPPALNKAEINREVSNLESLGTPGTRRDETDARGAAFAAPQFEPGKIPDVPPPRELC
ncbi:hypothetical protein TGP89_310610 [Toxoplasma gondii p89]|uniref:Nucleoporin FG repeat region protein n=1 Tax=Toxoplasma gondii p89 TaxID=943119 RepID=A0A086K9A7_TOXGO|nr:hypothetical protein TGP89_310610 [Toxoplasma gondii p89]